MSQEKLPVNTGPDGHFHRQRRSVIAPYACRLSPLYIDGLERTSSSVCKDIFECLYGTLQENL